MTKLKNVGQLCLLSIGLMASSLVCSQPYTEDFSDGQAQGWVVQKGNWTVQSGGYRSADGSTGQDGSDELAFYNTTSYSNFKLYTTIDPDYNNHWGVVFDYQDSRNYHLVRFHTPGSLELRRIQNGTLTILASGTFPALGTGQDHLVEINKNSGVVSVKLNGTVRINNTSANTWASGKVGLYDSWQPTWFDDFRVEPIAAAGALSATLSAANLSFGSQALSTNSVAQTVTLSAATGNSSAISTSCTMGGTHASEFTVTPTAAASQAAGTSRTLSIVFRPTASGSRNASLSCTSANGTVSPSAVSLTGTGAGTPSAANLISNGQFEANLDGWSNWGGMSRVTDAFQSTGALRVNGAGGGKADFAAAAGQTYDLSAMIKTTGGDANFGFKFFNGGTELSSPQVQPNHVSYTLVSMSATAPAGTTRGEVYFWQGAGNSLFADNIVVSTGSAAPTNTVTVAPNALSFSAQVINTSSAAQNSVLQAGASNTGNVTVSNCAISGANASEFTFASAPPASISLAANATQNIGIVFRPTATGARVASMTCATANPSSGLTVSLSGQGVAAPAGNVASLSSTTISFANQAPSTSSTAQSITLAAPASNGSVINVSCEIAGTNGADFIFAPAITFPVAQAAGTSRALSIVFRPTAAGSRSASLICSSGNGAVNPTLVALTGQGSAVTSNTISVPSSLSMGEQSVGSSRNQFVLVEAPSSNTLAAVITTCSIQGSNDFVVTSTLPLSVAPGSSANLGIRLTVASIGARTATLSCNATPANFTVALNGEGAVPSSGWSEITYNEFGAIANITEMDAKGGGSPVQARQSSYGYDSSGFLVEISQLNGSSKETIDITVNNYGQPLNIIMPTGERTLYSYDVDGRLISVSKTDGTTQIATTIEYAAVIIAGQPRFIGLPTKVTLPGSRIVKQSYDESGFPSITAFDETGLNLKAISKYNDQGFLIEQSGFDEIVTRYNYTNAPAAGQFGNLGIPSEVIRNPQTAACANCNIKSTFRYDVALNLVETIEDQGGLNAKTQYLYSQKGTEGAWVPTRMIDAENRIIDLSYTGFAELNQVSELSVLPGSTARTTKLIYTAEGWISHILRHNQTQAYAFERNVYNGVGDLTESYDALNKKTSYLYDAKGRVKSTQFADNITQYFYDKSDRIVEVKANTSSSGFRSLRRVTFDLFGRIKSEIGEGNSQTLYSYDSREFLTSIALGANTPAQQILINRTFDSLGRVVSELRNTGQGQIETKYQYGASPFAGTVNARRNPMLLSALIDPKGNTTSYAYNSIGLMSSLKDAAGTQMMYEYDNLGLLTKIDYPNAADVFQSFNRLGELLTSTRDGKTESWAYSLDGTVKHHCSIAVNSPSCSASNYTLEYGYDSFGRQISKNYRGTSSDPEGARSDATFSYLSNDQLQSASSKPDGLNIEVTEYAYDASDRLIERRRNNRSIGYSWNADNTLSAVSTRAGTSSPSNIATYAYTDGLLTALRPFGATPTTIAYRSTNQVASMLRASGLTTNFGYDQAGRLTGISNIQSAQDLHSVAYGLDANGNRTQIQRTGLAVQNAAYDMLNRLTQINYPAVGNAPAGSETHAYDAFGNRTTTETNFAPSITFNSSDFNKDGTQDLLWSNGAQLAKWTLPADIGKPETRKTLAFAPPVDSNWKIEAVADFNGDTTPDLAWRNISSGANMIWYLTGSEGDVFLHRRDLLARPDVNWTMEGAADFDRNGVPDLVWRNAVTGQNEYWLMGGIDGAEFQRAVTVPAVTDLLWQITGVADMNRDGTPDLLWRRKVSGELHIWIMSGNDGNTYLRTSVIQRTITDANFQVVDTGDFNRDGVADLLWRNSATGQNLIWRMDSAGDGNITSAQTIELASVSQPWTIRQGAVYRGSKRVTRFEYNGIDQQVNRNILTREGSPQPDLIDAHGNLLSDQFGTLYKYDAANRLMQVTKDGINSDYFYDALGNLIRRKIGNETIDYVLDELPTLPHVVQEISTNANTVRDTQYVYGASGLHAQRTNGSDLQYALLDGQGSLLALVNSTGQTTRSVSYDAWGNIRALNAQNSPAQESGLGYTGEQQFADGTVHLRARSYVPKLGRFLQRDMFAGFADRPQSLNRYAYVEGNPLNWVDPAGNMPTVEGMSYSYKGDQNPDGLLFKFAGGTIGKNGVWEAGGALGWNARSVPGDGFGWGGEPGPVAAVGAKASWTRNEATKQFGSKNFGVNFNYSRTDAELAAYAGLQGQSLGAGAHAIVPIHRWAEWALRNADPCKPTGAAGPAALAAYFLGGTRNFSMDVNILGLSVSPGFSLGSRFGLGASIGKKTELAAPFYTVGAGFGVASGKGVGYVPDVLVPKIKSDLKNITYPSAWNFRIF